MICSGCCRLRPLLLSIVILNDLCCSLLAHLQRSSREFATLAQIAILATTIAFQVLQLLLEATTSVIVATTIVILFCFVSMISIPIAPSD